MAKLHYAHDKERRAIEWARGAYGRDWRKHISEPVSVAERSFPYQHLRHVVARPFGRPDWNAFTQWARNCMRRNLQDPLLARRLSIGHI